MNVLFENEIRYTRGPNFTSVVRNGMKVLLFVTSLQKKALNSEFTGPNEQIADRLLICILVRDTLHYHQC
jgi:hypothetical protein